MTQREFSIPKKLRIIKFLFDIPEWLPVYTFLKYFLIEKCAIFPMSLIIDFTEHLIQFSLVPLMYVNISLIDLS